MSLSQVPIRRTSKAVAVAHQSHEGPCRGLVGVRCSTDEQLDRYGPDVQAGACIALATRDGIAVDPDADVVVISQSVTKFGGTSALEALDGAFYAAILQRLKNGGYCVYLTYDMTRLTRSGLMHQLMLEQEVKRHVSRVLYANLSGVDTATPEGEAFKDIMAVLNRLRTVLDLARLADARRRKVAEGYYGGEGLPLGYALTLDEDESRRRGQPSYRRYLYPPHVEVVEAMLRALVQHRGNAFRATRALRRQGMVVPPFAPDLAPLMDTRSIMRITTPIEGGWQITPTMIEAAACSRTYEGVLSWGGQEIGRDERLALADQALLAEARASLAAASVKPRGRAAALDNPPLPLAGLLYCLGPVSDPHPEPFSIGNRATSRTYRCIRTYANGDGPTCLQIPAHVLDGPVAEFILSQLRLGPLAGDVIADLEQEQADSAARLAAREQARRRLAREVSALESNLEMLLQSELLTPERYRGMEEKIAAKRSELSDLDAEPVPVMARHLDAQQAASVRQLLDNLEARWPSLSGGDRNDLLRLFLDRIDLAHDGSVVRLAIQWITGQIQVIEFDRPHYRPDLEQRWTEEENAMLRASYATAPMEEIQAALRDRSVIAIRTRAHKMGLARIEHERYRGGSGRHFSEDEDVLIRAYAAGDLNKGEVLAALGDRTIATVRGRMRTLGITRVGPHYHARPEWRLLEGVPHSQNPYSTCSPRRPHTGTRSPPG